MKKQKTIAQEIVIEGIGLHTGNMTRMTFRPAPAGHGITFRRTDLPDQPVIDASYRNVLGVLRGTTIGTEAFRVHTIEHILAACSVFGIDNLEICLTNNEPPVLDGSALQFAERMLKTGFTEQDAPKTCYTLSAPVVYEAEKTRLEAYPADEFSIDCTIGYDHPFLKHQQASFTLSPELFLKEIAPARTFCFDYEIEALKSRGLAKGGDFSNAIVLGLTGVHNPDGMRFPDEFVRHKTLDLIGDLYLLGAPLRARVVALRPGHGHNVNFAKELAKVCTLVTEE